MFTSAISSKALLHPLAFVETPSSAILYLSTGAYIPKFSFCLVSGFMSYQSAPKTQSCRAKDTAAVIRLWSIIRKGCHTWCKPNNGAFIPFYIYHWTRIPSCKLPTHGSQNSVALPRLPLPHPFHRAHPPNVFHTRPNNYHPNPTPPPPQRPRLYGRVSPLNHPSRLLHRLRCLGHLLLRPRLQPSLRPLPIHRRPPLRKHTLPIPRPQHTTH